MKGRQDPKIFKNHLREASKGFGAIIIDCLLFLIRGPGRYGETGPFNVAHLNNLLGWPIFWRTDRSTNKCLPIAHLLVLVLCLPSQQFEISLQGNRGPSQRNSPVSIPMQAGTPGNMGSTLGQGTSSTDYGVPRLVCGIDFVSIDFTFALLLRCHSSLSPFSLCFFSVAASLRSRAASSHAQVVQLEVAVVNVQMFSAIKSQPSNHPKAKTFLAWNCGTGLSRYPSLPACSTAPAIHCTVAAPRAAQRQIPTVLTAYLPR